MGEVVFVIGLLFLFTFVSVTIRLLFHSYVGVPVPTGNQHSINTVEQGLDEATLRKFPKLIYAQAKVHKGNSTSSCCSICLADYNDTDMLRLLPDCGHLFHLKCVDPWLRLHATCPICRNSPVAAVEAPPPSAGLAM